ncbi:type II toxin-antitoxin system VapC family toxin [Methanoplanus endosymbiosus]|uniref:Type II toxin-antitoxin system VapC family toxin n=1 Tax=Methanoplanus endosymbiosus TaxID=33865 RepID=A0A9E7TJI3_9EURY|nr:type II toxin-antitoxin system VapC family toxin [Methanoplanus endosymbiosus]UUX93688.1 type II toxin-antitoxin system VapC family toxin [Methanoplanus endosymbiosus]
MIIFDSTFLIDLIRNQNSSRHKKALAFLDEIVKSGETFSTTFVNVYELYKGAYGTKDIQDSIDKINEILNVIPVINHSNSFYAPYGELSAKLKENGTPIGKFDELVATIVIYQSAKNPDVKLVTNNTKDFIRVLPPSKIVNH